MPLKLEITNTPGYDTHIGHIVSTMNGMRQTTLNVIGQISLREIDFLIDTNANTIGTLLKHIAALEAFYRITYFENRELTISEQKFVIPSLGENMKENQQIGNELSHYLGLLEDARNKTLNLLKSKKDSWLYEEVSLSNGNVVVNKYYLLFHLIEDEINHRSHIKWIKNRFSA